MTPANSVITRCNGFRKFGRLASIVVIAIGIDVAAQTAAAVAGIGVSINSDEKGVRIGRVVPGSPAERAGLQANDEIVAIDGRPVANMDQFDIITLTRGAEGSDIAMTVRMGGGAPRTITMKRTAAGGGARNAAPANAPAKGPAPKPAAGNAEAIAGAPAWVKPGTRLTFYAASATMNSATTEMVLDKEGNWVIPGETGDKKYKDEDRDARASGQAYVQVNVSYVDRETAVLDVRVYGVDAGSGTIQLPGLMGWVGSAANGSDYWIHPAELAKMKAVKSADTNVTKGPYKVDGRTYDSIRIYSQSKGGTMHRVYDLETGVLLYSAVSSVGADVKEGVGEVFYTHSGGSSKGYMKLVSIRNLELPWNGAPAPEWVARTRALRFGGSQNVMMNGMPTASFPVVAELKFRRTGKGWAQFVEHSEVQGTMGVPAQQAENNRAVGTSQIGGLWIPAEALAKLRPGTLDTDPTTKMQFSYAGGQGDLAYFTEKGPDSSLQYVYNRRTGMLVEMSNSMNVGMAVMQLRVSLQRHE